MGRNTHANAAYETVRKRIANGELAAGERITEASISRMLNVGRVPARETLLRLEAEGLVGRPGPRKARYVTYVEDLPPAELRKQYEVREVIDGLAARLAATAMSKQQIAQLRALLEQYFQARKQENRMARVALLNQFYSKIRRECGNAFVEQFAVRCKLDAPYFRTAERDALVMKRVTAGLPFEESLSRIVDAIEARDPEGAESAMRAWRSNSARALGMEFDSS